MSARCVASPRTLAWATGGCTFAQKKVIDLLTAVIQRIHDDVNTTKL